MWVVDITYIPTWTGFLYLAIVLDVFSRRVVGWTIGSPPNRIGVDGARQGVRAAVSEGRDPPFRSGHAVHLDRLWQGAGRGVSGPRWDRWAIASTNAMAESFFASLECELLAKHQFKTQAEARNGRLRIHRRLLQSTPAAPPSATYLTDEFRKEKHDSEPTKLRLPTIHESGGSLQAIGSLPTC